MTWVKMTEDWRRALDDNLVVGVVFVNFRKAFDSISHPVLLRKLQELGVSGNLWSWIKNSRIAIKWLWSIVVYRIPVKFGVSSSRYFVMIFQISMTWKKEKITCMRTILYTALCHCAKSRFSGNYSEQDLRQTLQMVLRKSIDAASWKNGVHADESKEVYWSTSMYQIRRKPDKTSRVDQMWICKMRII
jgi:hypothetical protein